MICDLTDLPTEMCSHCRGLDKRPALPTAEHTMPARRDGQCPECRRPIFEGDMIGIVDGVWACSHCWL